VLTAQLKLRLFEETAGEDARRTAAETAVLRCAEIKRGRGRRRHNSF